MKYAAACLGICLLSPLLAPPVAPAWEARLEHVADGDSFVVRRDDSQREKIRLYGIDAPERGQPYSKASGRNLEAMLRGHLLDIIPMYQDPYGRTVAVVHVTEEGQTQASVNERQIRDGMAWYYPRFCKASFCDSWKAEEADAQSARRGLWRQSEPSPPWMQDKQKKYEEKGQRPDS